MTRPEKIAPGIFRVDAVPVPHAIAVFLVAERDGWTLIDTGLTSSVPRIQAALAALGGDAGTLRRIYLTHHHWDHVGGLGDLIAWAPGVEVVAPEHEAAIIKGEQPSDPSENPIFERLTEGQVLPINRVDRTAHPEETIAGFRILATPGHTFGHTSLLHEQHRLLITGDAFGQLLRRIQVGVTRPFCADTALAQRSAVALLDEDFATAVLSHGPTLREGAKGRLREAVERNAR